MTQPVVVDLTPSEVAFCMNLAAMRIACKPPKDRFVAKKISPFGSHLVGVIGEFAARRVFGGIVNQIVSPIGDGHAPDMVIDGIKFEIKTTTFYGDNPQLILSKGELLVDTLYVLAQLTWPDQVKVFPSVTCDEFQSAFTWQDFGHGERMTVSASQILELKQQQQEVIQ